MKAAPLASALVAFAMFACASCMAYHHDGQTNSTTFASIGTNATNLALGPDGVVAAELNQSEGLKEARNIAIGVTALRQAGRTARNADSESASTTRHSATEATNKRRIDSDTTLGIERERTARAMIP